MKKMKIFLLILAGVFCFSNFVSAKEVELVLSKEELMDDGPQLERIRDCEELFYVDGGKDVPDMRDFRNYFCYGMYTLTLKGPVGTTVTLFGKFSFAPEWGYLILKKTDDQMVWLLDLEAFSAGQWIKSEARDDSGGFEAFYHSAPNFKRRVSSVKWGKWWTDDPPREE